jgi:hypothetical protein
MEEVDTKNIVVAVMFAEKLSVSIRDCTGLLIGKS